MTADEANKLTMWYQLPIKIREKIEERVKKGKPCVLFYKSITPEIFTSLYYVDWLKLLGYKVEIENLLDLDDTKLFISWNY